MKKDQKYLKDLETNLIGISKKDKLLIISKYRQIIDEELSKKRKILEILKSIGPSNEVAKYEISLIKSNKIIYKIKTFIKTIFNFKNKIKKDKEKIKKKKIKPFTETKFYLVINSFLNNFKDNKKNKIQNESIIEEYKTEDAEDDNNSEEFFEEKNFSKKERILRAVFRSLGLMLIMVLFIVFLWVSMLFVSSLFALLDGVRFYGVNLLLFSLSLFCLWVVINLNILIFKKKFKFKINLFSIILIVLMIGCSAGLIFREFSEFESVNDVSEKYSMTTIIEKYNLPNDLEDKKYITFNSQYDTHYVIEYDNKLENQFKLEVKYYECFYDLNIKQSNKEVYVSLVKDLRDVLSIYIENLKDKKIFNNNELMRYSVRIIINEEDKGRVIINN